MCKGCSDVMVRFCQLECLWFPSTVHYHNLLVALPLFCMKSLVQMTKYLLSQPGGGDLFLLSEWMSQDPLENYFGQQRAWGGRCDNPTIKECLQNAVAVLVCQRFYGFWLEVSKYTFMGESVFGSLYWCHGFACYTTEACCYSKSSIS